MIFFAISLCLVFIIMVRKLEIDIESNNLTKSNTNKLLKYESDKFDHLLN
jgi:hypothetical protein